MKLFFLFLAPFSLAARITLAVLLAGFKTPRRSFARTVVHIVGGLGLILGAVPLLGNGTVPLSVSQWESWESWEIGWVVACSSVAAWGLGPSILMLLAKPLVAERDRLLEAYTKREAERWEERAAERREKRRREREEYDPTF